MFDLVFSDCLVCHFQHTIGFNLPFDVDLEENKQQKGENVRNFQVIE